MELTLKTISDTWFTRQRASHENLTDSEKRLIPANTELSIAQLSQEEGFLKLTLTPTSQFAQSKLIGTRDWYVEPESSIVVTDADAKPIDLKKLIGKDESVETPTSGFKLPRPKPRPQGGDPDDGDEAVDETTPIKTPPKPRQSIIGETPPIQDLSKSGKSTSSSWWKPWQWFKRRDFDSSSDEAIPENFPVRK